MLVPANNYVNSSIPLGFVSVGAVAFVDEEIGSRLDVCCVECGLLGTCTRSPMQEIIFSVIVMHGALCPCMYVICVGTVSIIIVFFMWFYVCTSTVQYYHLFKGIICVLTFIGPFVYFQGEDVRCVKSCMLIFITQ